MKNSFDVVVVGGGPAGLATAINTASEGLSTLLVDSKKNIGGQATSSSLIENYPGFPEGISGTHLTGSFMQQALRFGVEFLRPTVITSLSASGVGGFRLATDCEENPVIFTRSVVLALGLSYRKLDAPGVQDFLGRGVYYGRSSAESGPARRIVVVGGANSSGQAALNFASLGHEVTLLVRAETITGQMSAYLEKRVMENERIQVETSSVVTQCTGDTHLRNVSYVHTSGEQSKMVSVPTRDLYVYIGASPKTFWLRGNVDLENGYIVTNNSYETSIPGVFACGDVRAGSTKRVATAVGEGSVVAQEVRKFIQSNRCD